MDCCYSWISEKLWNRKIFCRFHLFCKDWSELVRSWKFLDINDFIQFTSQNGRNHFPKNRKNTISSKVLEPPSLRNLHRYPSAATKIIGHVQKKYFFVFPKIRSVHILFFKIFYKFLHFLPVIFVAPNVPKQGGGHLN